MEKKLKLKLKKISGSTYLSQNWKSNVLPAKKKKQKRSLITTNVLIYVLRMSIASNALELGGVVRKGNNP